MIRPLLLLGAAAALLAAVALFLVPFRAELATVGRNSRPLAFTVDVGCRAPVLEVTGMTPQGDPSAPAVCRGAARQRSSAGAVLAVGGSALLVGGLRHRPDRQPSRL